jgi:hypothetical protein
MRSRNRLNAAIQQLASAAALETPSTNGHNSHAIAAITSVLGGSSGTSGSSGCSTGGCEWLRGYCAFVAARHRLPGWAF